MTHSQAYNRIFNKTFIRKYGKTATVSQFDSVRKHAMRVMIRYARMFGVKS